MEFHMETTSIPLLEMKGIYKNFGAVKAVQNVDLTLGKGEILGLVGDNAAGKSTLMKCLTAVYGHDKGKIIFEGKEVKINSPLEARQLGIEMIYQDFSLAPNLSITDNIFLGREARRPFLGVGILNRRKMEQVSRDAMEQTHIRIDSVRTNVTELSGGQRQAVAIARATAFDAKIIIMDEPTASLSVKTIKPLLDLMRKLRDQGVSMIFITHRIQDIFDTCDRIMVMRRGVCVGISKTGDTNVDEISGLISGSRETFDPVSQNGLDPIRKKVA
jgi:simple sugar transport system ATP-binding protein